MKDNVLEFGRLTLKELEQFHADFYLEMYDIPRLLADLAGGEWFRLRDDLHQWMDRKGRVAWTAILDFHMSIEAYDGNELVFAGQFGPEDLKLYRGQSE